MLYPWERVHCKTGMFPVASTRSRAWIKYEKISTERTRTAQGAIYFDMLEPPENKDRSFLTLLSFPRRGPWKPALISTYIGR